MADSGRTYSFSGHDVAGVSWRPTRFVDEVQSSRVCDVCLMIPKRMVLLPCLHTVCPSCCTADCPGKRCPLHQRVFEEAECADYGFSPTEANILKVCCWNERHGCDFEGTIDNMLWHYENECTSHVMECPRCGKEVLHKNIPTHHVAECSRAIPSASNDRPFPENATQELEDAIAAEEYIKAVLADPKHEQLFSTIKSQMSELTDQVRNQQSKLDEIPRALAASERHLMTEIAQVGASVRSAMSDQPRSPNPTEESAALSSSPQDSENIYRRLEIFIDPSLHTLEELRKFSARHGVLCGTA
ncbi:hypothetical protein MTO96_044128, partial [Rhipicephalus appendiculatus]